MAMRWKMADKETGLRAVCAGPRSHWLRVDGTRAACVSALRQENVEKWYWVAGWESGIPRRNTCDEPVGSAEEAKAQALAYVRKHSPDRR